MIADSIGLPPDSLEASGEPASADHPVHIAADAQEAGTVAAQRITVTGIRHGQPMLTFRATWSCTTDFKPGWDVPDTGWHVGIDIITTLG